MVFSLLFISAKKQHTKNKKNNFNQRERIENQESKKGCCSRSILVLCCCHTTKIKRERFQLSSDRPKSKISFSFFFQQISLILIRFRFNIFTSHTINNAGVFFYTLVFYSFRVQSKSILVSSRFLKSKTIKFLIYFI